MQNIFFKKGKAEQILDTNRYLAILLFPIHFAQPQFHISFLLVFNFHKT